MFLYYLLAIFATLLLSGTSSELRDVNLTSSIQDQGISQRATQMVRYMNRINDWRYQNPGIDNVSISDNQLTGWQPVAGLSNVISNGRSFVWLADQPGLMAALLTQTRQSALVGRVSQRRLLDSLGNDMQLTVPTAIPDGAVVWVN